MKIKSVYSKIKEDIKVREIFKFFVTIEAIRILTAGSFFRFDYHKSFFATFLSISIFVFLSVVSAIVSIIILVETEGRATTKKEVDGLRFQLMFSIFLVFCYGLTLGAIIGQ